MKTNQFSAAGIRQGESRANQLNKQVVNNSKNRVRIYDGDLDFIDLIDRRETKIYSLEILNLIKRAGKKGISGANIRRKLSPEKIRMWDAAISLLCDDIETFNVTIPHYRYCVRGTKQLPTWANGNTHIFNKSMKPSAQYPADAIKKEFR